MKKYVTEDILFCIKHNNEFPQDVDYNKNIFIHFGKIGLTLIKLTNKEEYIKHINYWQDMTADEINTKFDEQEWRKDNV